MFNVNNKKTIIILAKSLFKENRSRNLFAVVAIVLTSILFTAFFTIGSSLFASMEESTMRQVGGSSHASLKYISEEEYNVIKNHPSIKDISYSVPLAIAENDELKKRPSEIRYTDSELYARGIFSMPTIGRLPQNDHEIATDTLVLKSLGVPAKLGQNVTLEYSLDGEKYIDTFELVGFWEGDIISVASQIWLNRSYVEQKLKDYIPTNKNDPVGQISADINFSNSINIEKKVQRVILDSGFTLDEILYGVNWAYTGNRSSIDILTVTVAVITILIFIFCGYLMIFNIFVINVANDIHYYGLIKTIGTTPKQICSIIRKQALWLCLIAIPIGMVLGYFVGILLVPLVLSTLNIDITKVSVNSIIFILSAIFSAITVFISTIKPSRIASKVSPIDALRFTDNSCIRGKFKNTNKINVFTMAKENIKRNKKKATLITISLSLGLIILNATFSFANSFDIDKYLSAMIGSDFVVGDVSNFNLYIFYNNQDTLSPEFFDELSKQDDIATVDNIYFTESNLEVKKHFDFDRILEEIAKEYGKDNNIFNSVQQAMQNDILPTHIYGLDMGIFEKLQYIKGNMDIEKLKTGNYVVVSPIYYKGYTSYYDVGDLVELKGENGEIHTYEVIAISEIPYNISVKHSHTPLTAEFYIPSDVFLSEIEYKTPMLSTINMKNENMKDMERFLTDYCNNVDYNMAYESKATFIKEYENMKHTYKVVGIVMSFIVGLIGIMNFINTVITSIISRKKEFAVLQSIGMTSKQMIYMLIIESILYMVFTIIVVFSLGNIICYFGIKVFTSNALYTGFYFTTIPSLVCLPMLFFIAIVVPILYQKTISKISIVERLREV